MYLEAGEQLYQYLYLILNFIAKLSDKIIYVMTTPVRYLVGNGTISKLINAFDLLGMNFLSDWTILQALPVLLSSILIAAFIKAALIG